MSRCALAYTVMLLKNVLSLMHRLVANECATILHKVRLVDFLLKGCNTVANLQDHTPTINSRNPWSLAVRSPESKDIPKSYQYLRNKGRDRSFVAPLSDHTWQTIMSEAFTFRDQNKGFLSMIYGFISTCGVPGTVT